MFKYSIKTAWTEKQQACPWEICLGIADRCLCLTRMEFPPAPWTLIQASSLIPLGSITHTLSVEKPMCNSLALLPKGSRVSHAASFRQLVFWLYLASVRCFCSWNDAIERCVFHHLNPLFWAKDLRLRSILVLLFVWARFCQFFIERDFVEKRKISMWDCLQKMVSWTVLCLFLWVKPFSGSGFSSAKRTFHGV